MKTLLSLALALLIVCHASPSVATETLARPATKDQTVPMTKGQADAIEGLQSQGVTKPAPAPDGPIQIEMRIDRMHR